MSSNRKGDRNERIAVRFLDGEGWAVMRAPASGSATERELPDFLAGDGDRFIATEVKSSGGDPIYIGKDEIEALEFFAENFGAEAKVAVKFDLETSDPAHGDKDRPGFYFLDVEDLHDTGGKTYRVKKERAQTEGTPEVEL